MGLYDFILENREFINAISTTVVAAFTVVLSGQLLLMAKQIKLKKLDSIMLHFPPEKFEDQERLLEKTLVSLGFNNYADASPLTMKQITAIINNKEALLNVRDYLNMYENIAFAINVRMIDDGLSYEMYGVFIACSYQILEPFIVYFRTIRHNIKYAYFEYQKLASNWCSRKDGNNSAKERFLRKMKENIMEKAKPENGGNGKMPKGR